MSGNMRFEGEIDAGTAQNGLQIALQRRLQLGGVIRTREPELQLDIRHAVLQRNGFDRLRLAQGLSQIGVRIST